MKERVKETGAIFQVLGVVSNTADGYALSEVDLYCDESDNINIKVSEDYWKKLKHQYAGMAMQGILSNPESELDYKDDETLPQALAECAAKVATALVAALKNECK